MATPIRLPQIGAGSAELSVSCWLVDIGELVDKGDRVIELLTAGMTFDVSAPVSGRLSRVDKPLDSPVTVGDILGWIDPETTA
ncbi:MAG: biotin attachment protein [Planctomycetaceae bacterium]|jgi:2-oxoisovalerate dehydrogenase E2 component (dihydrolipoyl transacylase)|nr:biotin attachment protein [Planctomycetaceae bacterium]MDP7275028.1 biotin/lipoyl-containing protein [Planctomycetaceae bacterium]